MTPSDVLSLAQMGEGSGARGSEIKARIAELGAIPLAETERWRKVVALSGIRKEERSGLARLVVPGQTG
ncbi:hypothetical protein IVA80_20890 [Bradyrhizobium sp. 139]|uniref:hypothetical protein n=1 Tax=Bradyrhizobium sp. 139 TaxID=2782616 RepID=UPI001FF82556|nr:hypothetical protein [Bradyrhizobium sp. 139]MCK1743243.1 hypothetical protein [Bradyrhizobium sp. 139]